MSADATGDGWVDAADFQRWAECGTAPGVPVSGPCAWSDLDGDGDADLSDYAVLTLQVGLGLVPECRPGDLDGDGDVDLADAGLFQAVFTGPRSGGSGAVPANPYLFTGRRLDWDLRDEDGSITGQAGRPMLVLYDYRARQYDPFHGRFLQRDPADCADNLNFYEYVRSNPLARTDPSGRQLLDVLVATLGQSELRAQGAYRAGVAGALILNVLGAYITYNEFGQMQWGVGGGISAPDFALFVEGVEATIRGSYAIGEGYMTLATIAVFSMSQAEAVQKVKQLGPTLFAHIAAVMTGGPDDPDRNHHLDEIRGYLEKIRRFVNRMAGGKVQKAFEKWLESALKWLENPSNSPPPGPMPG